MSEAIYTSRDWLSRYYLKERLNIREVAEKAGCSRATIQKYLERTNIPVRNSFKAGHLSSPRMPYRDKKWLRTMYKKKKYSIDQISILGDCDRATIRFWMKRHGVKSRTQEQAYQVTRQDTLRRTHGSCLTRFVLATRDFISSVREHRRILNETI